jgi:hypothetical protein
MDVSLDGGWQGGYRWTILWVAERGEKHKEKNTKLENEGEGRSMKAIPPPQEALTRRQ